MEDPFKTSWSGIGVGGALALDFVNTMDWRGRREPVELLGSYAELLRWAWSAGALDAGEARALLGWSESHPGAARRALEGAIEAREAMAAVFQAVVRGRALPARPLARLETACRAAWGARGLIPEAAGAAWVWREGPPSPERPAWAAVLDAERLLTSEAAGQVRECGDDQCGWLFLDTSRNRSRRWCSMKGCGNRNKVRSFYRRASARSGRGKS